ncbi:hypothetical protein U9M48_001617 [Paspalum notatum var. saurae]|uniref:UDP-glycosyltransferases domain-containing protein n=1 Tax=Paspalum notatum var. saurae TaxID=547442 RepID=A0AAQ3SJ52_PASNO
MQLRRSRAPHGATLEGASRRKVLLQRHGLWRRKKGQICTFFPEGVICENKLRQGSKWERVAMAAVGMPRYEWERNKALFADVGTTGMSVCRRVSLTLERCAVAAMKSCPEWEPDAFPLAAALLGKPLVPLGLVPPSLDGGARGGRARRRPRHAVAGRAAATVGAVRHAGERGAAAGGAGGGVADVSAAADDGVLPAGFEERTRGRGLVATRWVPQFAVLAHGAVGGFLTHCGRNSLVEGILYGHPLVMLAIFADQGPNARLMEKRKVGVLVARDEDDGSFDRHGVAGRHDTRSVFVENAKKVQQVVADEELQEKYIDEFVQKLRSYAATVDVNSSTAAATTPTESM